MSAPQPQRPHAGDDLEAAYARAHELAEDGGPVPSVRANVLAAARDVAERAKARVAAQDGAIPPLAPVAPPVAAVGRGRSLAVNLWSWRVRSGASVAAALLVALGAWRLDISHHVDGGVQVASASLEPAPAPATTLAKESPVLAGSAGSTPDAPAPAAVDAPVERAASAKAARPKAAPRDKNMDVVVAQAESSDRVPEQAAPLRMAPMSPAAPSGESRPADLAPAASLQAPGGAPFAAAAPAARLARIAGSAIRPDDASAAARPNLDAAKPATRAPVDGTGARPWPTALQSAAERGDVDALKALLAESSTRVDAPDAAGRTALLHAVLAQQAAAVRLLLAAGADPARADQAGLTPRAAAQAAGNAEIAGLLGAPR